ncbi:hypothetical protein HY948_02300 [Candidatus Gottesmanbacteria bacterium]|nr:hypothetical protein [Candidatus Gottesmanbacteria bacterium]
MGGISGTVDVSNWARVFLGEWPVRAYFPTVVSNNKIFVMGGRDDLYGVRNDIYSYDGVRWTQVLSDDRNVTSATANRWIQRDGAAGVSFQNKLWIFGGAKLGTPGVLSYDYWINDAWSSSDGGVTWTRVNSDISRLDPSIGATRWSPRWGHSVVVYNSQIYLMGGLGWDDSKNDVWTYGGTGNSWTPLYLNNPTATDRWSPRTDQAVVVYNGKIWLMGGSSSGGFADPNPRLYNDVWTYSSGEGWIKQPDAPWTPRSNFSAVVSTSTNQIWIMGGKDGLGQKSDIWSFDGSRWKGETADNSPATWPRREMQSAVYYNSRIWLMGGFGELVRGDSPPNYLNDVWAYRPRVSLGLSGGGDINYLPKFQTSNSLHNSVAYQTTSDDIGVNTNTPSAKFSVEANTNSTQAATRGVNSSGVGLYVESTDNPSSGIGTALLGIGTGSDGVGGKFVGGIGGFALQALGAKARLGLDNPTSGVIGIGVDPAQWADSGDGRTKSVQLLVSGRVGAGRYCDDRGNNCVNLSNRAAQTSDFWSTLFYGSPDIHNLNRESVFVGGVNGSPMARLSVIGGDSFGAVGGSLRTAGDGGHGVEGVANGAGAFGVIGTSVGIGSQGVSAISTGENSYALYGASSGIGSSGVFVTTAENDTSAAYVDVPGIASTGLWSAASGAEGVAISANSTLGIGVQGIAGGVGVEGVGFGDGLKLTAMPDSPVGHTEFGDRFMDSVVYNGKIWIRSSLQNLPSSAYYDQMWTFDGSNWLVSNTSGFILSPNYSSRNYAGFVNYKNKIYIVGGNAGPGYHNDVWTYDGTRWDHPFYNTTEGDPNIRWSPRGGHATAVFNNRLWVLGGDTCSSSTGQCNFGFSTASILSNDVWSYDGNSWVQSNGALWSPRSGHKAVTYKNKLWIIGGKDRSGYLNDVWSYDGNLWTREAPAPWTARNPIVTLFGGKIYVVGGLGTGGTKYDTWSFDGVTWKMENSGSWFSGVGYHTAITYNNNLWVFAGSASINPLGVWSLGSDTGLGGKFSSNRSDLLSTQVDGKIRVTAGASSGIERDNLLFAEDSSGLGSWDRWELKLPGCSIVNNSITCGGSGGVSTETAGVKGFAICAPEAGGKLVWRNALPNGNTKLPRGAGSIGVAAFNSFGTAANNDKRLWAFGNAASGNVWNSIDGINWKSVTVSSTWTNAIGNLRVISPLSTGIYIFGDNTAYVSVGATVSNLSNLSWFSLDGRSWGSTSPLVVDTELTHLGAIPSRYGAAFAYHYGQIVETKRQVKKFRIFMIGGSEGNTLGGKIYNNDVWSSGDGATWVRNIDRAIWSPRTGAGAVSYRGALWMTGGRGESGYLNDVWYSLDGIMWIRATGKAAWLPRSDHSMVVYGGRMWIIGGYASGGRLKDVWSSYDGKTWEQSNEVPWSTRENPGLAVYNGRLWVIGDKPFVGSPTMNDVWYAECAK